MNFLIQVVISLVLSVIAARLAPKPDVEAATLGDLKFPNSEPGRMVMWIFGRERIEDATVAWYGDLRTKAIREGNSLTGHTTIGYQYFMGAHFILCYGEVDSLNQIFYGDRLCFDTVISADTTGLYVNEPELFGGKKQEGGIQGYFDFIRGGRTHDRNTYLVSQLGADVPAFRGRCSVVFNQTYWTALSRYIKKIGFDVTCLNSYDTWQSGLRTNNGDDMNLAHITRLVLIDRERGLGKNENRLDDASFVSFAQKCDDEGLYISIRWGDDTGDAAAFMEMLKKHGDFFLFLHPTTGLYTVTTSRDDYVLEETPLFDESNSIVLNHTKSSYALNTPNQVTVIYRDRAGTEIPITVDNMGNQQRQGRVINETVRLPGIRSAELATRVARRILNARSVPAGTAKVQTFFKHGYDLVPGTVVRVSSKQKRMVEVPMRVLSVNRGQVGDNKIIFDAVEDVFELPGNEIVVDQGSLFSNPSTMPLDVENVVLKEASYYQVHSNFQPYEVDSFPAGFGVPFVMARSPGGYSQDYIIYSTTGSDTEANYIEANEGDYCPHCTLNSVLNKGVGEVVLNVGGMTGFEDVILPQLGYLNDEMVLINTFSLGGQTVTIMRALFDTVPQQHAAGSRLFLAGQYFGMSIHPHLDTETAYIRLKSRNGAGELHIGDATAHQIVLANRYAKPYPPRNVRFGINYYPSSVIGDIAVTWTHSDRAAMLDGFYDFTDTGIANEGSVYNIRLYDDFTDELLNEVTGTSAASYSYTNTQENTDHGVIHDRVRIEIESELSALLSHQKFIHSFAHTNLDSGAGNPHRYWRIFVHDLIGGSWPELAEIELRASLGGADLTGGGTDIFSSEQVGAEAEDAFDNNGTSYWAGDSTEWAAGLGAWIGYDLGASNDSLVLQIQLTARSTNLGRVPADFSLHYSDNGTNWYLLKRWQDTNAWAASESRTYNV